MSRKHESGATAVAESEAPGAEHTSGDAEPSAADELDQLAGELLGGEGAPDGEADTGAAPGAEGSAGDAPGVEDPSAELHERTDFAIVGGVLDQIFLGLARRRGPHWRLQPEERDGLAGYACQVADKYGSWQWLQRIAPELMLAGNLTLILWARLDLDQELAGRHVE